MVREGDSIGMASVPRDTQVSEPMRIFISSMLEYNHGESNDRRNEGVATHVRKGAI